MCVYVAVNFIKDLTYLPGLLVRRSRRSLCQLLPTATPEALDLLNKLVHFNPLKRVSASSALEHPFVVQFHNPDDTVVLPYDVIPKLNDNTKLTVDEYRKRLYQVGAL